ncbi:M20/M25/M40 family metallo-hydrolase [Prolixibacteraceae bacterium Z1-6]|uniref:M20/M25/M40 family metallo-hydrolase n=1 Tax=Draconibacterium aestuarii TaxID=2998507 RepID=A0A9X3JA39_9BACT|nr:M20/M25/M40 family metallo-hydrolase [Prolixibacteraceae bacterium Z1-6]
MKHIVIIILLSGIYSSLFAKESSKEKGLETINKNVIQAQLGFLASDWMEGREAGTAGNYLAGDYLSSLFKLYGLVPGGDEVTFTPNRYQKLLEIETETATAYFQTFPAIEVSSSENQNISFIRGNKEIRFQCKTDFSVSFISQNSTLKAPVVFVGYGIDNSALDMDDFKDVDVEGKIVVRLAGLPGDGDPESKAAKIIAEKDITISTREKNAIAFGKGAVAVMEYNMQKDEQYTWKVNEAYRFNEAMFEGDTKPESFYDKKLRLPSDEHTSPVISISKEMLEEILAATNMSLEDAITRAAILKTNSVEVVGEVRLDLNMQTQILGLRNIIGRIEGENPDEIMVIGAHYDHLGKYNGQIFNGADDNGSGVVAVTTIAKAFIESGIKPKCTLIFALWDGEERGLLGSRHFINSFEDMEKVTLYLNFDMVGRNSSPDAPGNKVAMIYTKAYTNLVETSKLNIENFGLNLDVNYSGTEKPTGGSDNSGFAKKDIPIFWFHTGGHTDYHQASDHVELINWQKLEDIIKLSYLNMWEFANNPLLIAK